MSLINMEIWKEKKNKEWYLRLTYEYRDNIGNLYHRILPKVEIPVSYETPKVFPKCNEDELYMEPETPYWNFIPDWADDYLMSADHNYIRICKYTGDVRLSTGDTVTVKNIVYVDELVERTTVEMTMEEIEKKIGCKVKIVSDKE